MPDALAVLGQLDDPAAALDAAVLAGVVAETGGPASRRPPADRRRRGGVAAARPPPAPVPAAGRGRRQPGAIRALRGAGRRAGPDVRVADALDAAAAAAHARAGNAEAAQFAAQAVRSRPDRT